MRRGAAALCPRVSRRAVARALSAAALAALPAAAAAAPAPRDPAVNGGAPVQMPLGNGATVAALAPVPGGGVAGAGTAIIDARSRTFTFRRTADGAADVAFGGGMILSAFGGNPDAERRAAGVAVQPDGHVLMAGVTGGRAFVVRYRPDGSLDPLFGGGGVAFVTQYNVDAAAIVARPDGRVLVAGSTPGPLGRSVVVVGLTDIGGIDTSFASRGFYISQEGERGPGVAAASAVRALALAEDGSLYAGGFRTERTGRPRALVMRLDGAGARMPFGDPAAELPGALEVNALQATPDGVRLAGATVDVLGWRAALIASLGADGAVRWSRVTQLGRPTRNVAAGSELHALGSDGLAVGLAGTTDPAAGGRRAGALGRTGAHTLRADRAVALRIGDDGTIGCGGRDILGGAGAPLAAGGNVAGMAVNGVPTLVGLAAAPPPAVPDPPATGPVTRLRKRNVLTGVADPGCSGGRGVFVSGGRRVHAGRLVAGAGPQTVRAVTKRVQRRFRLTVVRP